jgi:hypothetical protein
MVTDAFHMVPTPKVEPIENVNFTSLNYERRLSRLPTG